MMNRDWNNFISCGIKFMIYTKVIGKLLKLPAEGMT